MLYSKNWTYWAISPALIFFSSCGKLSQSCLLPSENTQCIAILYGHPLLSQQLPLSWLHLSTHWLTFLCLPPYFISSLQILTILFSNSTGRGSTPGLPEYQAITGPLSDILSWDWLLQILCGNYGILVFLSRNLTFYYATGLRIKGL